MTSPRAARDALEQAVANQAAQRAAAQESRNPIPISDEPGMEKPETDRSE